MRNLELKVCPCNTAEKGCQMKNQRSHTLAWCIELLTAVGVPADARTSLRTTAYAARRVMAGWIACVRELLEERQQLWVMARW